MAKQEVTVYFLDDKVEKFKAFDRLFAELNVFKTFKYRNGFGEVGNKASEDAKVIMEAIENSKINNAIWLLDIQFSKEANRVAAKELLHGMSEPFKMLVERIPERYSHFWDDPNYFLFRVVVEFLLRYNVPFLIASIITNDGIPYFVAQRLNTQNVHGLLPADLPITVQDSAAQIDRYVLKKIVSNNPAQRFLESAGPNNKDHVKEEDKPADTTVLDRLAVFIGRDNGEELLSEFNFYDQKDGAYINKNFFEECNKAVNAQGLSLGVVFLICWAAQYQLHRSVKMKSRDGVFKEALKELEEQYAGNNIHISSSFQELTRNKTLNASKQSMSLYRNVFERLFSLITFLSLHERKGTATLQSVMFDVYRKTELVLQFDISPDFITAVNERRFEIDRALSHELKLGTQHHTSATLVQWTNLLAYSDMNNGHKTAPYGNEYSGAGGIVRLRDTGNEKARLEIKFCVS